MYVALESLEVDLLQCSPKNHIGHYLDRHTEGDRGKFYALGLRHPFSCEFPQFLGFTDTVQSAASCIQMAPLSHSIERNKCEAGQPWGKLESIPDSGYGCTTAACRASHLS